MSDKLAKDYKDLIQQKNVIEHRDFERIVREVYGLSYDVQRGEYSQNSYIEVKNVDGTGCDDDMYLDEDGEYLDGYLGYSPAQPPESWVLNNLCARGIIEPGNYLITIDW